MINESLVQELRRNNVSIDSEKTKQRFEELWKATSPSDKKAMEELAGVARATLYRIYDVGSISAKIAVAASQIMNVSPYYLTGEADEPGESSEQIIWQFLDKLGYKDLLAKYNIEPKSRKTRKKSEPVEHPPSVTELSEQSQIVEDATVDETEQPTASAVEISFDEPEVSSEVIPINSFFDEFDEEDIILLIRSVKIRVKAGVPGAIRQEDELRQILLS